MKNSCADANCLSRHDSGGQNLNYWLHVMTFLKGGLREFEEMRQKVRNLVRNETSIETSDRRERSERWRSDIRIEDARESWEGDPRIEERWKDARRLARLKKHRHAIGWDHRAFFDWDPFSESKETGYGDGLFAVCIDFVENQSACIGAEHRSGAPERSIGAEHRSGTPERNIGVFERRRGAERSGEYVSFDCSSQSPVIKS